MQSSLIRTLARSLLAGEFTPERMIERANRTLGRPWNWLPPLVRRILENFGEKKRPRLRELSRLIAEDRGFRSACSRHKRQLRIEHYVAGSPVMQPKPPATEWDLPALTTRGEVAQWLSLPNGELDWLADLRGWASKHSNAALSHYHYRILDKKPGGIRLLEAPKAKLKAVQRKILAEILEQAPPHPAAHGFVKGRSVKTFLESHVGTAVLLRMDLRNFFPSFRAARIQALFRTLGYPESVADTLGGLCMTAAPSSIWKHTDALNSSVDERLEARRLYGKSHLPQGAPTSPGLANICAYRMDCRLSGLAKAAGAKYTRYADDLAFSGDSDFDRRVERFSLHVAAVVIEENFSVHHRKTRIMRRGVRQHLAGLVTNEKLNLIRPDFDLLKAILTNCARSGPASQNRAGHTDFRAHLEGRVAYAEQVNSQKATRLRATLNRIDWNQ